MSLEFGWDITNAVIIGGLSVKYEFWQKHPVFEWQELIASEYFESDEEAINWLKNNHPGEYDSRIDRPIEMRVFDQPRKRERMMIDARNAQQQPSLFTEANHA